MKRDEAFYLSCKRLMGELYSAHFQFDDTQVNLRLKWMVVVWKVCDGLERVELKDLMRIFMVYPPV